MKTVNFLPQWYFQEQRERRRLRIDLCLMLVLGAAMVTWATQSRSSLVELRRESADLERQAAISRDYSPQIQKTELENRHLENLQVAYHDLGNTVPMSAIIQQLPNNMTPGMSLSNIGIDVHPEPIKSNVIEAKSPQRFHEVAHLTVVGIAPNDLLIAQLIGKLSANPLFSEVSLNYSRTETLRTYMVRRFQIQMTIDLDRLAAEDPNQHRDQTAAGPQQPQSPEAEGHHAL